MNYIILDLEATCWKERNAGFQNEIIEIGALKVAADGKVMDEFSAFIRPKLHPVLSPFCTELTTITQTEIDQAKGFTEVIQDFWKWIDLSEPYLLCSWGFYDKSQFKKDCLLHELAVSWLKPHISLKHQYAKLNNLERPIGMGYALKRENLKLEGTHHRGIDDARNITKIFKAYIGHWKAK